MHHNFIHRINQILEHFLLSEDENEEYSAAERIEKARYLCSIKAPFFYSFFKKMKFIPIPDETEKTTMAIDQNGNVYYGQRFVNRLDMDMLIGVLCHEAMHVTQRWFERKQGRITEYWNWAGDYANNRTLISKGFKLPYFVLAPDPKTGLGHLTDENGKIIVEFEIHDKSSEEIYEEIVKKMEQADRQPAPSPNQIPPQQNDKPTNSQPEQGPPEPKWEPKVGDIVWNDTEKKYGKIINVVGPNVEVRKLTEKEAADALKG